MHGLIRSIFVWQEGRVVNAEYQFPHFLGFCLVLVVHQENCPKADYASQKIKKKHVDNYAGNEG